MGLLRWRIHWAGLAASLPLIALFPLLVRFNPYYVGIATQIMIAATAVQGLNLILGYTGQISLAQGGLMAIGAYSLRDPDEGLQHALAPRDGPRSRNCGAHRRGIRFSSHKIKLFYVAIARSPSSSSSSS